MKRWHGEMKLINFEEYQMEIDYEKTLLYYDSFSLIGEDDYCKCIYCENYKLSTTCFPKSVIKLLSDLGVDPNKAMKISHFYEAKNGKHMYIADYKVFGKILKKPNMNVIDIYYENDEDYFRIGFENIKSLKTNENIISFHIDAFIPWQLEVNSE